MDKQIPATIDAYISTCPPEVQPMLQALRNAIRQAAPEITEKISWGMATFVYHGNLVHFSAEKKHIGFHPTPSAIVAFADALSGYACSKGTVRFPYEQPLPLELVQQMVRFRLKEQEQFAKEKPTTTKARTLRPRNEMPEDIEERLRSAGLKEAYEARPPYQRNDYIGWITRAKRPETREKRLCQMLEELRGGDAYMGMAYTVRKSEKERTTYDGATGYEG